MRNSAVLFRGINQVLDAYDANEVPSWAIWNGKTSLIFKHVGTDMAEGAQLLKQALEKLRKSGTEASLILAVYEAPGKSINNKTPFDNSFPFSLWDPMNDDHSPYYASKAKDNETIEELRAKVAALEADQEEEPEMPTVWGKVMGMIEPMLSQPDVQQAVMYWVAEKVRGILNINKPVSMAGITSPSPQPAAENSQASNWDKLAPDQQQKLNQAIEILMGEDPQIGDHLLALAIIARDNRSKYNMALKFL